MNPVLKIVLGVVALILVVLVGIAVAVAVLFDPADYKPLLASSESKTLANAAAEGSLGLLARATLVVRAGDEVLAARPENGGLEAWRLRVEGVAREIDATFPKESLTPALTDLRKRIVEALA